MMHMPRMTAQAYKTVLQCHYEAPAEESLAVIVLFFIGFFITPQLDSD
jgi:hypothetical protein